MSEKSDNFDNPLYDALLKRVHEDIDTVMASLEKDWPSTVVEEYQGKYPDLPPVPDKPPPVVASILWENELRSSTYVGNGDNRKKRVRQPVGFADLSVIHYEHLLTEEFGDLDEVSWCVSRAHQLSVLHLLCRPALTSMAQTVREINSFRNRISEETYERQKIGTEYYGILTCNPEYEQIARSQDIWYVYIDEHDL